jgi:hypothetical protein
LSERQFEAAILSAIGRGVGAEADASALRELLVGAQAVTATRSEAGAVVYSKVEEFPTWDNEVGPGSAAFDRQLAEMSAREQADHDRVAADIEKRAPQNLQRQELDAHIRQVVDERIAARIDARIRELRAELRTEQRREVAEARLRATVDSWGTPQTEDGA